MPELTVSPPARGTPEQDLRIGRIVPTVAINAFKSTGIAPDRDNLIVCHGAAIESGSPAVALVAAMGYHPTTILANARVDGGWLAERLGVTGPYLSGFHSGFFGLVPSGMDSDEYRTGWKDGSAAFAAVRSRVQLRAHGVER